MARFARVIAPGAAHHITQRGNAQRDVFLTDSDRLVYLQLLGQACQLYGLELHGYCLMPNHLHLIAVPERPDSLARALKDVHGRYAQYLNLRQHTTGHVWQGRYYSCPLDQYHLWEALRYTELNPIRARLVDRAEHYPWSSAAAHCSASGTAGPLQFDLWRTRFDLASWREFLQDRESEASAEVVRRFTHMGRPLGSPDFVRQWESTLERKLTPSTGGRRARSKLFDEPLLQGIPV